MRRHIFYLFLLLWIQLGFSEPYFPQPTEHSFYKLGPNYSIPVYARPKAGARLVLFNYKLADALKIDYPKDPKELEEWAVKNFALRLTKEDDSEGKKYFASLYQDSIDKSKGGANGDGRALWLGEIISQLPDGKKRYLDLTAKGVGRTPLAWTKHSKESHKDGFLSMDEAIHSYVVSQALLENQIDSTGDLMVFELPQKRFASDLNREQNTAISIRIGNHTRFAHWRFHSDNPENLKPIIDYSIKRDLGFDLNHKVEVGDYQNYLKKLSEHLGGEYARSLDLLAAHGSPTQGNRSTNGASIDNATTRFLDAEHVEHPYLYYKLQFGSLEDDFRKYIDYAHEYIGKLPGMKEALLKLKKDELFKIFEDASNKTFEEALLLRHGLTPEQIQKTDPVKRALLVTAFRRLSRQKSEHRVIYDENERIYPADIEMRKVIPIVMELMAQGKRVNHNAIIGEIQNPSWKQYSLNSGGFISRLLGLGDSKIEHAREVMSQKYIDKLTDVIVSLDLSAKDLKLAAERAKTASTGQRDFKFWEQKRRNNYSVYEAWKKTQNFTETSQFAQSIAEKYVDPLVPPAENQHLGTNINSAVRERCEQIFHPNP